MFFLSFAIIGSALAYCVISIAGWILERFQSSSRDLTKAQGRSRTLVRVAFSVATGLVAASVNHIQFVIERQDAAATAKQNSEMLAQEKERQEIEAIKSIQAREDQARRNEEQQQAEIAANRQRVQAVEDCWAYDIDCSKLDKKGQAEIRVRRERQASDEARDAAMDAASAAMDAAADTAKNAM